MRQPGKKSGAALAVADASLHLVERPAPPADLTDIQRLHWVEICNSLPAEWFRDENKAVLAEYCRTLSTLAFLNAQIDEQETKVPAEVDATLYFELLKRRESLVRVQLSQATKMRLTQQSRYGARGADGAANRPTAKAKPWALG